MKDKIVVFRQSLLEKAGKMLSEEIQAIVIFKSRGDAFRSCLSDFELPVNGSIRGEIVDNASAIFGEVNGDLSANLRRRAELRNRLKVEKLVQIERIRDKFERKPADVFLKSCLSCFSTRDFFVEAGCSDECLRKLVICRMLVHKPDIKLELTLN